MGKSKKKNKRDRESSQEAGHSSQEQPEADSIDIIYRPFSNFGDSPMREARVSSDTFWANNILQTPSVQRTRTESPSILASSGKEKGRAIDRSIQAESSPSQTGKGTLTKFIDLDDPFSSHIQKRRGVSTKSVDLDDHSRSGTTQRPQSASSSNDSNQTNKILTGANAVALPRGQGTFRELSLRRGSGLTVETPVMVRREINKRTEQGRWPEVPSQTENPNQSIPTQPSFSSNPTSSPKEPSGSQTIVPNQNPNPYGLAKPRYQRGDVPPMNLRATVATIARNEPTITVRQTATASSSSSSDSQRLAMPPPPPSASPSTVSKSAAAVTVSVIRRRQLTADCKMKVLEACLLFKDAYLDMPRNSNHDQQEFWSLVWNGLPSDAAIRGEFKDWKHLKNQVEDWCYPRRLLLREGKPLPLSANNGPLDQIIDQWNLVFAHRWCDIHRGYIEVGGPPLEERITSLIQLKLNSWINEHLQRRRNELKLKTRPPLLVAGSPLHAYRTLIENLQDGNKTTDFNSYEIRESEAIASFIAYVRPNLQSILDQGNQEGDKVSEAEIEIGGAKKEDRPPVRRGFGNREGDEVELVLPSIESQTPNPSPRTLEQLGLYERSFRKSLQPVTQQQSEVISGKYSGQGQTKKRKTVEQPPRADSFPDLTIQSQDEQNDENNNLSTPSRAPSKRPRAEERQQPTAPTSSPSPSSFNSNSDWEIPSLRELISSDPKRRKSKSRASRTTKSQLSAASVHHSSQAINKTRPDVQEAASEHILPTKPLGNKEPNNGISAALNSPGNGVSTLLNPKTNRGKSWSRRDRGVNYRLGSNGESPSPIGQQSRKQGKRSRFRESTADFRAMPQIEREVWLFQAVKKMDEDTPVSK